jgi:hypothetical protein
MKLSPVARFGIGAAVSVALFGTACQSILGIERLPLEDLTPTRDANTDQTDVAVCSAAFCEDFEGDGGFSAWAPILGFRNPVIRGAGEMRISPPGAPGSANSVEATLTGADQKTASLLVHRLDSKRVPETAEALALSFECLLETVDVQGDASVQNGATLAGLYFTTGLSGISLGLSRNEFYLGLSSDLLGQPNTADLSKLKGALSGASLLGVWARITLFAGNSVHAHALGFVCPDATTLPVYAASVGGLAQTCVAFPTGFVLDVKNLPTIALGEILSGPGKVRMRIDNVRVQVFSPP